MSRGSILVVCTGNICRSPLGEAILHDALSAQGITVTSAGTHAAAGREAEPVTIEFASRELDRDLHHVGRQLDQSTAESTDLIITMTEEHRSWVAKLAPRTVRRIFTLVELQHVLALLRPDQTFETVRELAMAASRLRARAGAGGTSTDIPDPYGGPPEGYESSFRTIAQTCALVIPALRTHLQIDAGEPHHG
ncbi:protein-tyrosine phosphatase [Brachybacterium sp. AG952]|uniref:arsenate reductase/protein-tyrosine-phosphatase family protein n=1 Tax=Brachybacterium sp. AG952 TaxID=2183989 RepID=UPI00105DAD74|nr:hypothetical protein [Brachybacterium sp. AG952]TDP80081.1 protein-tyrosine phosphatase [Brachybacterium sp. AG952]